MPLSIKKNQMQFYKPGLFHPPPPPHKHHLNDPFNVVDVGSGPTTLRNLDKMDDQSIVDI